MSKKKSILLAVFVFLAIIYLLTANYLGGKRTEQEFLKFYNSEIYGEIKNVYIKHHGVGFQIKGNSEEWIFYPITSGLNQNKIFDHLAKCGDSIIKRKNSDTLILIQNDCEYRYTFERFDKNN
ncbi:MAG: hypothetical protein O9340_01510 [Cyclobacteriaceae bacterium]|jgi:hypothetical protein|nr:hypothetical protein [Cyclobacteriaceae bacterium]